MTEVTGPWTTREVEVARQLWQALYADAYDDGPAPRGVKPRVIREIARRLNRLYGNVEMRLAHHGPSFNAGLSAVIASPRALAEREMREVARCNLSLIGVLMNDPPPGFSALDRKREGVAR
ncbi:MAG: hypothetical protein KGL35_01590 [Bradyrhizobium sp.]|nr:hypothetical protein [Bradyrhizobium sp.]